MGRPNKPRWREQQGAWVTKIDGRLVTLARGKSNRAAANRELRRRLTEREAGPVEPGTTVRIGCDLFLSHVGRDRRPLTFEWYARHLLKFGRHVGLDLAMADVRPHHVTAWLDSRRLGPTTRCGAITALKRAWNWARKQGLIDGNPLADMEKPTPSAREQIMTREQARRVFLATPDREFRDFLTAMEETGMRPSEAMKLEARMIDFDAGVAVMEAKGRPRTVYMNEAAAELFRGLAARWPEGPILRNRRGRPWTRNATASRFARLRAITPYGLGPEATAESYRHAFATDALIEGVPSKVVAELLGHRSTKMVDRHYSKVHQRAEHLSDAVRRVRPRRS